MKCSHDRALQLRRQMRSASKPLHRKARVQVFALLYYIMSYFPGGALGMQLALSMAGRAMLSCFGSATRSTTG